MIRAFALVLALASVGASGHPGEHAAVSRAGTAAQAPFVRGAGVYRREPVALVRSDGARVALDDELAFDGPVVVNFIFTSCSAVCPIATRTLAELQERLRPGENVRIMSISLDPLNDTPDALRAYARKAGARAGWRFYTGSVEASVAAQRAFDLFRGDKMNHAPVTLVRSAPGAAWVRLEGFPTAAELAAEVRAEIR
ncbi:SCO family protein [Telluria sp. Tellsp104]